MEPQLPSSRDSLYGEATAELRTWLAAYAERNRDMLDLMARM